MSENIKKRKIRNDIILIGAILVLFVSLLLGMKLFEKDGDTVVVLLNGEVYGRYSLFEDQTVRIVSGENGEHYNILVIKDGKAYIEDANCPGIQSKTKCTNHKPIPSNSLFAINEIECREHRLLVYIESSNENENQDDNKLDIVL